MNGLLLLDKPGGMTSHDVVARVRRAAGMRRVGHAGTLDPMATGLLVLALGQATRTLEYLTAHDKGYEATVRLGETTDTYDAEGKLVARHEGALRERAAVEEALNAFRGALRQRPPAFSALKQGGVPNYERARRGEAVELPERAVAIYDLVMSAWSPPEVGLRVHCSKGTYIRSLAHDLGAALGVGAHLSALRRTSSGAFHVRDALPLGELEAMDREALAARLLPPGAGLEALPAHPVSAAEAAMLRQGKALPGEAGPSARRAVDEAGALVAVVAWRADRGWQPEKVFAATDAEA